MRWALRPPTQGIASAISNQPPARRSLPILSVMPRHPEARPASEHGRLLPCVWVQASTQPLDEAVRLAQSFRPYNIKLPFLEMAICVFPRAAHHRKPIHHTHRIHCCRTKKTLDISRPRHTFDLLLSRLPHTKTGKKQNTINMGIQNQDFNAILDAKCRGMYTQKREQTPYHSSIHSNSPT